MKPDWVGVASDELFDGQAVDRWRTGDALLFAVDENDHRRAVSLALGGGQLARAGRLPVVRLSAPA
jgi:hypothetical protein